ncbi:aromatic compound dioxygenase [Hypoxylon trugodes]|uniref:aromatic compound dioxygenase n=1 Tax=Hypoxylon trugodes TaxID=326681 RepID=UPI002191E808|nr:aromatic compound dioxygenase [Hypoxylon trugodes]KAI1393876.1 aromatic compound dioxygenase [Hypoxylon trugodes]
MAFIKQEIEINRNTGKPEYDLELTEQVIAATGPDAHPRLAEILPSLVRHLHGFARDVNLTVAEWMAGIELINEAGRMSNDRRDETGLLCDILGLESLVDEITSKLLLNSNITESESGEAITPSAILGPFYRANAPILPNDSSILRTEPGSDWYKQAEHLLAHLSGHVTSATTGKPLRDAMVDIWLAGPNGLYEQQDPSAPDMNLRGRFLTDANGRYALYCIRPTAYPVPGDGPAGRLLKLLDRHPYRPAHIHFIVSKTGYRTLTTQVFDVEDKRVADDVAFAVKKELMVKFKKREGDDRALWDLEYDFTLSEA